MDRPDTILCYSCGAPLGRASDGKDYWDCTCGKRVRPCSEGRTREATPEYLSLLQELDALRRDFREQSRPFEITVGGTRGSAGRREAPDVANTGCQTVAVLLIFCGLGVLLLFYRAYGPGAGFLVFGIAAFLWMKRDSRRRIEGYQRVKADYEARCSAIEERLGRT